MLRRSLHAMLLTAGLLASAVSTRALAAGPDPRGASSASPESASERPAARAPRIASVPRPANAPLFRPRPTRSAAARPVPAGAMPVQLVTTPALLAPAHAPAAPGTPPSGAIHGALHTVGGVLLQTGGLAVGVGEKILGRHSPEVTNGYRPVEVPDPTGMRSVAVYRSNQPRTVGDIAQFVALAKKRGATDPSQITIINLRSEKDADPRLVAQYEATARGAFGQGRIHTVDVKILDNAPPAFYVGPVGWNHAVEKIGQVYRALNDPNTKVAVIHCEQGEGRTGEVVATAVRIAMDHMPVDQALAEATAHGLKMPWQRAFIVRFAREWQAGRIRFDR